MANDIICRELAKSIKRLKSQIAAIRKTHPTGVSLELQDLLDELAQAESVFQSECVPAKPPLARLSDIKFELRPRDPPASVGTFGDPNDFSVEASAGQTIVLQVTATAPSVPGQADTDIVYVGNSAVPPLTLSPPNVFQVLPQGQSKTTTLAIQIPLTAQGSITVDISALVLNVVGKIGAVHVNLRFQLRLDGIEVTQAIQDMNQSVKLIAGKATVVRVYLSYPNSPAITVRGEMALSRTAGGGAVIIPSLNAVTLDPSQVDQLDAKRQNLSLSLNFLLPAAQTSDESLFITLSGLTDMSTGRTVDVSLLNARKNVTFTASPPLRLRLIGIRHIFGTPPSFQLPSVLDFGLITSWLRRAYPVGEVIISQSIVDANATPPFEYPQINAQIAAIRALDMSAGADARTHYYGLVSDGGRFMRGGSAVPATPDPSAVGSGPTGPGNYGWDFDGSYGDWYTGHELAHTLGRNHPVNGQECSGALYDPKDSGYPFSGGQLSNADDAFVGFDVGDPAFGLPMAVLPGTIWHDLMTYCPNVWLSSYTYEGIRTRLVAEDDMSHGPPPGSGSSGPPDRRFPENLDAQRKEAVERRFISLVATVNLTKSQGKIEYVNPLPKGEPSQLDPTSVVVLHVRRADGSLLHEYSVGLKPSACRSPGEDRLALVDAVIPVDPDARTIEMSVAGQVADTFRAGATPPAVRGLKPASFQASGLALEWETDASPGDNHTYNVQTSTDEGHTWQTMAVGLRKPEVMIDRQQFHGAKSLLVRVISTDGFSSSVLMSESLPINKA